MTIKLEKGMIEVAAREFVEKHMLNPQGALRVHSINVPGIYSSSDVEVYLERKPQPNYGKIARAIGEFVAEDDPDAIKRPEGVPRSVQQQRGAMIHLLRANVQMGLKDASERNACLNGTCVLFNLAQRRMRQAIKAYSSSEIESWCHPEVQNWAWECDYPWMSGADDSWFVFRYKNHRGDVACRAACRPVVHFGVSVHHGGEATWYMQAFDLERWDIRDFRMSDIQGWGFHVGPDTPSTVAIAREYAAKKNATVAALAADDQADF